MKLLFLFILYSTCCFLSAAQSSLSDAISDQHPNKASVFRKSFYKNGQTLDSGWLIKGIPDGKWTTWYKNGNVQFIRTYSADKWKQFQNEKTRYHPKRVSMPITKLYHDNRKQAEKYTTAINSFCGRRDCVRSNEQLQQIIDNNVKQEHYHPVFENGLLHGVFINYFPDGMVKDSGNYKNGLPEGLWIKWTDDRQFYWQGFFEHGLKDKEWKLYSSNRKLIRITFYRMDRFLWRKDMAEGVEAEAEE